MSKKKQMKSGIEKINEYRKLIDQDGLTSTSGWLGRDSITKNTLTDTYRS